jgi:calcium-dependent protein kinase
MKYKDLKPTKKVGNYAWNHQAHLGSGAFGDVYLGRDTRNNDIVAVKVMSNSKLSDPYLQEALKKEIKIMSSLKSPNTVHLLENLASQSNTYLIQEFCDGGDFRHLLNKKTKLDEAEARKFLNDFLSGFAELVKLHLVHRDIKPENVLIKDGIFKVADFGFAREVQDSKKMLTTCVGTPLYMSPQILLNQAYTSKADVWSTGMMFYETLYGKTAWTGRSQQELTQNILRQPLQFPYNVNISEVSKNFLRGCLQVEEKNRLSWEQIFAHEIYKGVGAPAPQIIKKKPTLEFDHQSLNILRELQDIVKKHNVDLDKVFKNFDKTGDQTLDINEFTKLILVINEKANAAEVREIFVKFDANKDNSITLQEFRTLVLENDYSSKPQENGLMIEAQADKLFAKLVNLIHNNSIDIYRLISKYDKSGDFSLDINEFGALLKEIDDNLVPKEVEYLFKRFDKDQGGSVSALEFKNLIDEETKKIARNRTDSANMPAVNAPVNIANLSQTAKNLIFELRNIIQVNRLDLSMIFQTFDSSKDGNLDINEFKSLVQIINARQTENDVKEVFKAFDADGNGNVSLKEFEKLLR